MKVLIVNIHKNESSGGSEIQCHLIAAELKRLGHDIVYLCPTNNKNLCGIDSLTYRVRPIKESVFSFIAAIKDEKPDVIYWRSYKRLFYPVLLAIKSKDIPVVFAVSHIHDLDPRTFDNYPVETLKQYLRKQRNKWITKTQLWGYQYVSAMTTLNADYLPLLPTVVKQYIPNAMELDRVHFSWPRPYCLWVANLKGPKQPQYFVRLAKKFSDLGIDFLMIGRFLEEFGELRYILDDNSTPDNFYYLGEKSPQEVNGALESCLFHVHTCLPEGFGNIFIQSWLSKKTSVSLSFNPGNLSLIHI